MIGPPAVARFDEHEYQLLEPAINTIASDQDADRLCTALALVDGFQFDLVVCPTARDADALLAWLANELPRRRGEEVAFDRMRPERERLEQALAPATLTASVLGQLERRSPAAGPGARSVAIVDATGFRSDEIDAWRWLFQRINERRNWLVTRVGGPLLWLLPPALDDVFANDAPDLWSIRSLAITLPATATTPARSDRKAQRGRFDPAALASARAEVAGLRTARDLDRRALARALRKLAELELEHGHLAEAMPIVERELVNLADEITEPVERAKVDRLRASVLLYQGHYAEALALLQRRVIPVMEAGGTAYQRARSYRALASALIGTNQLEAALWHLREMALPLDEEAGDVHGRAETFDLIGDALYFRGDLDEALRIRREEGLMVYERLGDIRGRAITMGKIADILTLRGELDEALRIRRDDELPVYERLHDELARTVALSNIADILQDRGDLDEALRIRVEDQLPVFRRLGDVRAVALTMGKIAEVHQARGNLDEALRIRREQELPVYARLGDTRTWAVTQGRIATILQEQGDLDEAIRIRRFEQLPVFERAGADRDVLFALANLGSLLISRGRGTDLDEARRHLERAQELAARMKIPFPEHLQRWLATDAGRARA